jgi:hypothetical protein
MGDATPLIPAPQEATDMTQGFNQQTVIVEVLAHARCDTRAGAM